MITVAGFNTSIDKLIELDVLQPGAVQRARSVQSFPGGKGLHVAQTIAALGEPVRLVGLIDACNHAWFRSLLRQRGVEFVGVEIAAPIRTCLALRERDGRMTEVLESGPTVDALIRSELVETFRECAADAQLVVLSGSLPPGCGDDTYAQLVQITQRTGQRALVDTSGEALRQAIAARPFAIKPNRDEAAALAGYVIDDVDAAIRAAQDFAARGVAMPVISLGAAGALALNEQGIALQASVPSIAAVNAVGSGDCFIAGMAVAIARGEPLEVALRLGIACGAANAMSQETGFVQRDDVDALLPRIDIEVLQ